MGTCCYRSKSCFACVYITGALARLGCAKVDPAVVESEDGPQRTPQTSQILRVPAKVRGSCTGLMRFLAPSLAQRPQ